MSKRHASDGRLEVPSVSELQNLTGAGSASLGKPSDSNVHMHILRYCTKGEVYGSVFHPGDLYVVHLTSGSTNVLFSLRRQIELFGLDMASKDIAVPGNVSAMAEDMGAVFQVVASTFRDADDVGFRKYRCGFYVSSENLKDLIMYLDDLFYWRADFSNDEIPKVDVRPKLVLHVEASAPLTVDAQADEVKCEVEVKSLPRDPPKDEEVSVYQLPPPIFPPRIVIATFEIVDAKIAHIIFSGNTRPFQRGFHALQIKGQALKRHPEDSYGEYFRVLPNVDLSEKDAAVAMLVDIFGDKIFHHSPVVVRLKPTNVDTKNLRSVLEALSASFGHLRFDAIA